MSKRELLEKSRCGSVKKRPTHSFAASNDFDELTLVKRLEHLSRANAPNLFDLCAANGLAIRDDGQRLERSGRQTLGPGGKLRSFDRLGVFWTRENLPSTRHFDQLYAVLIVIVMPAERGQGSGDVVTGNFIVGNHRLEICDSNRVRAGEQRGFKQLR